MAKILHFSFRNDYYEVNEQGHIRVNGLTEFSPSWIFLGGSSHHWHNHVTVTLRQAFEMPGLLDGLLGWDMDHGTVRQWCGRYYGKLPRIRNVYVSNEAQ